MHLSLSLRKVTPMMLNGPLLEYRRGSKPYLRPGEKRGSFWSHQTHHTTVLDLGSSYVSSWQGVSAFASGTWFYQTYHKRGLFFDKYVAVELEALKPEEAYSQLPEDLVGVYTLINVGLTFDGVDKLDAVELIRAIADKEHFFVLKLDIDSAGLELPLAHALRDDPSLAALVNELFFQHHVDLQPLRNAWGYDLKEKIADSYDLFSKLRSNGIRAHSWP